MKSFKTLSESSAPGGVSKCQYSGRIACRITKLVKWFRKEPTRIGWLITASCFLFYTASYSLMYGFSLLFVELQQEFDAKTSVVGYVGCLMSATAYLTSPLTAYLETKISHRSITVLGTLLCSLGAFTSSFVPSIYYLFLTLGVSFGLGVNFLFHASLCLQLEYFPTNSERPVTLGSVGFSASWLVTLPMLHYFIQSYGWRVAMQIMSAVILGVCLISCIPMCPPPRTWEENQPDEEEKEKEMKRRESKADGAKIENKDSKKTAATESKTSQSEFLRTPGTWIYSLAVAGTMSGFTFYFVNLASYLTSMGLTEGEAASILFMCGIGEILGKIILYSLAGCLHVVPSIYIAIFGNIIDAVFTIGLVLSNTYATAAAFVILASFGRAIWHIYPITGGVEELKHPTGVSTMYLSGMGAGYIMGSFLVGGLHDITGSYALPMVLVSGVFALSGLLFATIPLIRYIKSKRRQTFDSYYSISVIPDCPDCEPKETRRKSRTSFSRTSFSRTSVTSVRSTREPCEHDKRRNTLVVDDQQKHYIESLISAV